MTPNVDGRDRKPGSDRSFICFDDRPGIVLWGDKMTEEETFLSGGGGCLCMCIRGWSLVYKKIFGIRFAGMREKELGFEVDVYEEFYFYFFCESILVCIEYRQEKSHL